MGLYHFNPCKLGRHPALVGIGDALAEAFQRFVEDPTEGCPCCMAVRILVFGGIAALAGFGVGLLA